MKLIKVKNFADRMTAEQAQLRLREQGVECLIQSISPGAIGTFGVTLPQGADLYVREDQADKAKKILVDLFGDM